MSPHRSIDTEIPCFTVDAATVDPMLLLVDNLRDIQTADSSCCQLSTLVGAHPLEDYDNFGVSGRLLPSGHFVPELPELLRKTTPVTVILDLPLPLPESPPHVRVDASHLRMGVQPDAISIDMAYAADEVLPQALQLEELIAEQAQDVECREFADLCGQNTVFDHNDAGLLVLKAPLDGSEQIVVPAALRPRLLHLEQYPRVAGHPGVSRMFRSLRRRYFWRNMSADVTETFIQCAVCSKNRIHERKRTSFLKLFPASEPLEYVSFDILGPLPKTEHGNRFLLVITDRFSKLTRTVPLRTISAFVVAKAFCEHWVFVYGPPIYALTDNGAQFSAKFFLAVCRELGVSKVFTTAYHPQTNGQVERYNRTIINSLRGYVS
jgi:Integrase zinc binding domain